MGRLVTLTRSSEAEDTGYDVRLGPLSFVTPADTVGEAIGDGLDVVGAALTASERRPRPLKLKLPVRGYQLDFDPTESGKRLRRQVRQVFDNAKWRLQGFYFVWDADPDLDGWLLLGGAELEETDPGISFGEFAMTLSDVYLVGRPGTHRPGRRASIGDRRGGLVPRDTRRLLYSTDFASQALPTEPVVLPGDSVDLVSSGNRPVESTTLGPLRGARRLWRNVAAEDAEIFSYLPDPILLTERTKYLDLDDLGSVRVWDLSKAEPYPPEPDSYTGERDERPDLFYGWERVLGNTLTADRPLAIDNGVVRLIWLGPAANQGLAIEYWDETFGRYHRAGRVLHSLNVREQRVIETTPERVVIEWRAGRYGLRAILQRGWAGPRLESYDDGGETARLEYAPETEGSGAVHNTPQTPTWVRTLRAVGPVANPVTKPSFEHDALGSAPSEWTSSSSFRINSGAILNTVSTTPYSGSRCMKIETSGASTLQGADIRTVDVTAGKPTTIQVAVRGNSGGEIVDLDFGDGTVGHSNTAPITLTTAWQLIEVTLTPSATGTTGFAIREHGAGHPASTFFADQVGSPVYADGDMAGFEWSGAAGASATLTVMPTVNWASGSNDEIIDSSTMVISGEAVAFRRKRVLVAQLSCPTGPDPEELASLSLIDARPVPVLIGRS